MDSLDNELDLDLDIDNYEYTDLLNLFKVGIDFVESDLKLIKKKVLMMHPDKSGLDKRYFLFFSKAFKILCSVYEFREKANICEKLDISKEGIEYLTESDESNKLILDNLKRDNNYSREKFNDLFNKLFEELKVKSEYEKEGYGSWLKDEFDESEIITKDNINEYREKLSRTSLKEYKDINEFNNGNYCDLTNSKPVNYSSDIFSNLQYEDLKKAHSETIVPIDEFNIENKNQSYEQLKFERSRQNIKPLSDKEANNILFNKNKTDNIHNSARAYKLFKQEEQAKEINNKFWTSLKQLK